MNVKEAFKAVAAEEDDFCRPFIPCFDEFYQAAVEVIPGDRQAELKVLDLGAGTGLYSGMVQAVFPRAELTLIDLAVEMLEVAKARFAKLGKSSRLIVGDYVTTALGDGYDLIISACSIHQLSAQEQENLAHRLYDALKPGGMFINADQILGKTPRLEQFYQQQWLDTFKALGVADAHLKAAAIPLETQLHWLELAGFEDVDCYYKHFSFAVFGGYRPLSRERQQPTLTTERLILRPFTLADTPAVKDLASDRDIAARTLMIPHPYQEEDAKKWIKTHPRDFQTGVAVNFAIVFKANNLLGGSIGLLLDQAHNHAELGYWIGKPFWGQGYCTEAAKAVVQYGFEHLKLQRIHSGHCADNPASGRVMQKIGMKYEGCHRQHILKWGNYLDLEKYAILKSDWELARSKL